MKLVVLTCSGRFPPWLTECVEEYQKKIGYWFKIESKNLGTAKSSRDSKNIKIKEEAKNILGFLEPSDYVILCDEGGRSLDSIEFSKQLNNWLSVGKKRIVFIVGGAFGVAEEVRRSAQFKLSFSSFTINHYLAFAVLLEQIYRAITILKGARYHNE